MSSISNSSSCSCSSSMIDPTAGEPYNGRGRSEGVWKILIAYGFCRTVDAKGRSSFDGGPIPHPCFEYAAREECYKGKPRPGRVSLSGEMYKWTISRIAQEIRMSLLHRNDNDNKNNDNNNKNNNSEFRRIDDATLVRDALSINGLELLVVGNNDQEEESYYYSFCTDRLENKNQFWHCRICRQCASWHQTWHCKCCDECQYSSSSNSSNSIVTTCQTCNPNTLFIASSS
jgi:hypothetical protein